MFLLRYSFPNYNAENGTSQYCFGIFLFGKAKNVIMSLDKKMDKEIDKDYYSDFLDEENSVVSTNDLTGLISAYPQSEEEAESYSQIYELEKESAPVKHTVSEE